MNIAKFSRTAFLKNTAGGCFWRYLLVADTEETLVCGISEARYKFYND